jgi:hypothetical protein
MTDRLDAIAADLERPEVLNTENGCSVANVGSGDVRWLVAEVKRLRQRLEDVNIKDAAKTAEINILTAENRKLCERKAWYGDYLALRQRHAEAVEKAFRDGYSAGGDDMSAAHHNEYYVGEDAAWLASEAKARLT